MQPYILGIDIGTGSTKAVALNEEGAVIASSQSYYSILDNRSSFSEQDPEHIWEAFADCLHKITAAMQGHPEAISLSSCMHSLLLIDFDGKPITNLITWADTRSEKIADTIRRSHGAENLYRTTGTPVHSMSPLCKIIWFAENAPGIFKRAFKFISIKEFIWYKIFNEYQVDYSIASGTGLFNIEEFKWNTTSLNLCGINKQQLSEIVSTSFICKDVDPAIASLLNLPQDISFCIGGSDGCLANLGSYAITPGSAAVTIGTSGAVRAIHSSAVYNYPAMTFNYLLDEKTFVCGGPVNNGGNVIRWLFKSFLRIDNPTGKDYEQLFETIQTVPAGCGGLLFLPYLQGERAPVWDEKSCGLFFGIKSYHTNAHFLRAGLEGICYCLNAILEIIQTSAVAITQLNVSGGFVNSKTWMQILADVTGKKLCLTQTEDASAIGAALLGMRAINLIDSYPSSPGTSVSIKPCEGNHLIYKKHFAIFNKLYGSLKDSMHELYEINN